MSAVPSNNAVPKKKYVRAITERRREQNRRAQKAYKQRQKERLENVESLVPDRRQTHHEPRQNGVTTLDQQTAYPPSSEVLSADSRIEGYDDSLISPSIVIADELFSEVSSSRNVSSQTPQTSHHIPRLINLADIFVNAGDLPMAGASIPGLPLLEEDFASHQAPVASNASAQSELSAASTLNTIDNLYGGPNLSHVWDTSARSSGTYSGPVGPTTNTRLVPTASPRRPVLTTRGQDVRHAGRSDPRVNPPRQKLLDQSIPSDPYVNNICLSTDVNVEAFMTIAKTVGISRIGYVKHHPSRFPGCFIALNQSNSAVALRNIIMKFETSNEAKPWLVTKDLYEHMDRFEPALRPTPRQLLAPHPGYLDCIVFPWSRECAVRASIEGTLDHTAFFADLMQGGLVCWGMNSGATRLSGRQSEARRKANGSIIWDPRSWEARRWFLKKWEWLLGSEEAEMKRGDMHGIWRGSRWWWRMRGEGDEEDLLVELPEHSHTS